MKHYTIGATMYKREDNTEYLPGGYLKGISRFGGIALPLNAETSLDALEEICNELDGMLFTGGDDVTPSLYGAAKEPETDGMDIMRDKLEISLLKICLRKHIPVLGICRGCQIINVALGGTLVQHVPRRFGNAHYMPKDANIDFWHYVRIVPGTRSYDIFGGDIPVDSYHHQCVDRLATGMIPVAYAPEGFIEAYEIQDDDQFLLAVQWHPEVTVSIDQPSQRIFDAFGTAVISYASSK